MLPDNQYKYRFNYDSIDYIKHKYLLIDWIVNSSIIIIFLIIISIALKRKQIINEQIESNKNSKISYKRQESRLKTIERFTMIRVKQSIRCLNKKRIKRSNSDTKITLIQAESYAIIILEKDSFIKDLYTQPIHYILNKFSASKKYQEMIKSSNVEKLKILHHCYSNNVGNITIFNDKSNFNFESNMFNKENKSLEENEVIETFPISLTNNNTNEERINTITLDCISLNSMYKENTPNVDVISDKNIFINNENVSQEPVTIPNSNSVKLEEAYLNSDIIKEFDQSKLDEMNEAFKNFQSIPHPGDKLLDQSVICTITD